MKLQRMQSCLLLPIMLVALAANAAERTTYLVPDASGSPVAAMNEQGDVVWRKGYLPYGKEISQGATHASPGYTGKTVDMDTGLIHMGARMYDPDTARFTGIDPQGFNTANLQSFGRYSYANNSPYLYVDPNGEAGILMLLLGAGTGISLVSPNANAPGHGDKTSSLSPDGLGVGVLAGLGVYVAGEASLGIAARAQHAGKVPKSPNIDPKEVAGKTPGQIDKFAKNKGLIPKGQDPKSGAGSYVDPVTGKQRILTHPNSCSGPHCHVNNAAGERLDIKGNTVPPESPGAHLPLK